MLIFHCWLDNKAAKELQSIDYWVSIWLTTSVRWMIWQRVADISRELKK